MAFKQFALDEQTPVTIYKRRSSRSLRLSITAAGGVKVSIPTWLPYSAGLQFAKSKRAWIRAQQRPAILLAHGQSIGKAHRLEFKPSTNSAKPSGRLSGSAILVTHPAKLTVHSPEVQKTATEAAVRALRRQAEQLLPQRLAVLADKHGFKYKSVTIKRLKSRWGSCDNQTNIVLNLYLMQLSWAQIDYVLLHELAHTQVLRHGPDFWRAMERVLPNAKELRKSLRDHHPVLDGSSQLVVA